MLKNRNFKIFSIIFALVILILGGYYIFKSTNSKQKDTINIAYSTDNNYIYPTIVSMTSLMENADKNTNIKFTVLLDKSVSDAEKEKLKSLEKYKNCSVNLIDMGKYYENSEVGFWSRAMYYRLDLPNILKNEKKCIYIDGDTIVRHDLREMINIDMSNYYIGGIRDFNILINNESQHYKKLGIDNLNTYVCSGVLLMNLEKMRNDKIVDTLKKLVEKNDKEKIFHFPDQDALNKACYGHILTLPFKYGALIHTELDNSYENSEYAKWASNEKDWEEGRKNPVIVHYTGPKPWTIVNSSLTKEWWHYADKTNFKNDIHEIYKPKNE